MAAGDEGAATGGSVRPVAPERLTCGCGTAAAAPIVAAAEIPAGCAPVGALEADLPPVVGASCFADGAASLSPCVLSDSGGAAGAEDLPDVLAAGAVVSLSPCVLRGSGAGVTGAFAVDAVAVPNPALPEPLGVAAGRSRFHPGTAGGSEVGGLVGRAADPATPSLFAGEEVAGFALAAVVGVGAAGPFFAGGLAGAAAPLAAGTAAAVVVVAAGAGGAAFAPVIAALEMPEAGLPDLGASVPFAAVAFESGFPPVDGVVAF